MSKGSNQRPKAVDDETFESNWEATFGHKGFNGWPIKTVEELAEAMNGERI